MTYRQLSLHGKPALGHGHIQKWKRLFARALILGGRPNALADDVYMRYALEHLTMGALKKGKHLSRNAVFSDYLEPLFKQISERVTQVIYVSFCMPFVCLCVVSLSLTK